MEPSQDGDPDDGDDEMQEEIADLEQLFWLAQGSPVFDVGQLLANVYGYGQPGFVLDTALTAYETLAKRTCLVVGWADEQGDADLMVRVTRIMQSVQESYSALVAINRWNGDGNLPMSIEDAIFRFSKDPEKKELSVQTVYRFVLGWTARLRLRHRGDIVYSQIYTTTAAGARVPTHAWLPAKEVMDDKIDISNLELLVSFICTKHHNADMWITWVGINTKAITEKLRLCIEPEFPNLQTTRAWIAFSDGLYGVYYDDFIPHEEIKAAGIPDDMAVCAYHKVPFSKAFLRGDGSDFPIHGLLEVETPLLDTILATQKLCGHTQFWLMAIMGRCLYNAGVLDNWQVCLFLKGRAGTGKSTLVNFLSSVYDYEDVSIISNNAQADFGLMQLDDKKKLWVAPEVKSDFGVDQASFQSLVSCERISINKKHSAPFQGIIRAPGAIAGNTLPLRWIDNAGSIRRRIFLFNFSKKVLTVMNDLFSRLSTEEMPYIVRKINWCYRQAVAIVGDQDLWQSKLLSPHLMAQNEALYVLMNPLRAYLCGSQVRIAEGNWCPLLNFIIGFKAHCQATHSPTCQWNVDFYDVPFKDANLSIRIARYRWNSDTVEGSIVVGACIQADLPVMAAAGEPELIDEEVNEVDYFSVPEYGDEDVGDMDMDA